MEEEIKTCFNCGKKIVSLDTCIICEDIPFEGCSSISYRGKEFFVSEKEYCCFDCLIEDMKKKLEIKED